MHRRSFVLSATAAVLTGQRVHAQAPAGWPTKAIRFVITAPAGTAPDVIARILSEPMSKSLGQPIIVENKPGAAGNIATDFVAKAAPDGHTILMGINSVVCINPHIYPKLPFDALKDFAGVAQLSRASYALIVAPGHPAKSLTDLMAIARQNPSKMDYASSGIGSASHVITELLSQLAGVQMTHIPFQTSGLTEVIGGQIPFTFEPIFTAVPNIRANRVRALAVSAPQRLAALPEVPAVAETFPGYDGDGWHGVLVPAKTPRPVVQRLNAAIVQALQQPEVSKRLREFGLLIVGNTPDQFDSAIHADYEKWGRVAKAAKISVAG